MKTLFDDEEALQDGFPGGEDDDQGSGEEAGAGVAGSGIYTGDEDKSIEAEQDANETGSGVAGAGFPPDGGADDDEANPGDDEYTDTDEDEDLDLDDDDDRINSDQDADDAMRNARDIDDIDYDDDEDLDENSTLNGSADDLNGAP